MYQADILVLTPDQFLRSGAESELTWLKEHGRPRFGPREYREFTNYEESDPIEHIESIEKYLHIVSHLLPTSPEF
jgi:hypothetical protein